MSDSGFLERMREGSRARAARARATGPSESVLEARARSRPVPPPLSHDPRGFDVIAEVKLRSPAEGPLARPDGTERVTDSVLRQARAYAGAGAAAISVLTEPDEFHGSLDHLRAVADAVRVPVLRKDFLVDPYQVLEAREHGAGGVLLIARILDDPQLERLTTLALALDLFVLVEAFDEPDLRRIGDLLGRLPGRRGGPPVLVGLNCRDLETLQVEPSRFTALSGAFPDGGWRVAESGIGSPADAAEVAALGYDLALIGSALMRAADPGAALAELIRSGRSARVAGLRGRP